MTNLSGRIEFCTELLWDPQSIVLKTPSSQLAFRWMRATSLGVFASRRKVLDDRDVIGVIRVKFPNSLTDKEIDTRDVTIVPDGKTSIGSY